jgi:hypothetical protein
MFMDSVFSCGNLHKKQGAQNKNNRRHCVDYALLKKTCKNQFFRRTGILKNIKSTKMLGKTILSARHWQWLLTK